MFSIVYKLLYRGYLMPVLSPYSHLIKSMKAKSGKSLNSLLYEWNKAKREIEIEELKDPNGYSKIVDDLLAKSSSNETSHRDLNALINARFEKNVLGDDTNEDETDLDAENMQLQQQDELADAFAINPESSELEQTDDSEFNDLFGDLDSSESFDDLFTEDDIDTDTSEPDESSSNDSDESFDELFQ